MIEIAMLIAACVAMAKIADAEGRSSILWGVLTLLICLGTLAIPLPMLRIFLGFAASFILMIVAKAMNR